jgi:hypothetical protein
MLKLLWALDLLQITLLILDWSITWEVEQLNIKNMNVFDWKWDEMKRNGSKCNEIKWGKSKVLHRIDSNWKGMEGN